MAASKASREMEIANAKLAKFARRAKIAVGVMVAAAVRAKDDPDILAHNPHRLYLPTAPFGVAFHPFG